MVHWLHIAYVHGLYCLSCVLHNVKPLSDAFPHGVFLYGMADNKLLVAPHGHLYSSRCQVWGYTISCCVLEKRNI